VSDFVSDLAVVLDSDLVSEDEEDDVEEVDELVEELEESDLDDDRPPLSR